MLATSTESGLRTERSGDVLAITLNRPDKLNAITLEMVADFERVLDAALEAGIRVITVTGEGRAFSAGADLSAIGTKPGDSIPFLAALQALFARIAELPIPVIALVNGTAMGGGLELILAADFAIASESAKVGDGHTNVGVIPGGGGAVILPKRIPLSLAKYLVFTGDRMTAHDLRAAGLYAEVVAPEQLLERGAELAEKLAAKSPLALREIKRLMHASLPITDPAEALALELEANREYSTSYDMAEGMRAFAEKRPPQFEGR